MKIIFLDIDGVLNCRKTSNPRKLPYVVDRVLLKRLTRLLDRTGAKVVLSSTWRYDPAGLFSAKYWGIPFIDLIPDMPKQPRCKEILAWLKEHPRVKRFVIIDDDDDELDELPLFQPSPVTGLTQAICTAVAKYFHGLSFRSGASFPKFLPSWGRAKRTHACKADCAIAQRSASTGI